MKKIEVELAKAKERIISLEIALEPFVKFLNEVHPLEPEGSLHIMDEGVIMYANSVPARWGRKESYTQDLTGAFYCAERIFYAAKTKKPPTN